MDFGKLPFLSGKRGPDLPVIGEQRQQLVDTAHGGQWYQAAREGRVFIGNAAAAGSVLPIFSNTTQVFGVWNPKGSGINVVPISLAMTFVSTTGAAGGYCLGVVKNTGSGTATAGQGISAFTDGTLNTDIFNGLVGTSRGPSARFTPSAATVTAPVILVQLGLNQLVITAADATNAQWRAIEKFDGSIILPPGTAAFVGGNIATLSILACSIMWAEEAE